MRFDMGLQTTCQSAAPNSRRLPFQRAHTSISRPQALSNDLGDLAELPPSSLFPFSLPWSSG